MARFMSGKEKPKHSDASTAAAVPINTSGEGRTGPSCTINPTPVKPQAQPSSFLKVSRSSLNQAEARVPNTTAVELSRAT